MLQRRNRELHMLSKALLNHETLTREEIKKVCEGRVLSNKL